MKMIITRTALVLTALALAFFASVGSASAQTGYPSDDPVVGQIPYTGPFGFGASAGAAGAAGTFGFGGVDVQVPAGSAIGADGVGGTGGGLAITGSETSAPLLAGIALVSIGGVVLVAARRRDI